MLPVALIEQRIAEAIAQGELQQPERGAGEPINLDPYFAVHEDDRMAYAMLKSSGHVPPEVQWLSEMSELRAALQDHPSDEGRARLVELETAWQMRLERARRR